MRKTRIAHLTSVHTALDPRIFYKECRSLARAGFDVTLICPYTADVFTNNVHIKAVPMTRSRVVRLTSTMWRILWKALHEDADVYHFHDPELILVGLILRVAGKTVIYDIHEDFPKDALSKSYLPLWSRHIIAKMMEVVEGISCSHFSALVTVTTSIAERVSLVNRQTVIVHNYTDLAELCVPENRTAWTNRRQSVAYVGGITSQRGIREMVAAMALLPEPLEATLELAGNQIPEEIRAEELYEHAGWRRVRHHGLMDRGSTLQLLNGVRAGLVCLHPKPNHLHSIPVKIFEYMGAGLPIIASDFRDWRAMLGDYKCAIFVDPYDPRAIARAIEFVLTHPSEAEEMGIRGRAAVMERYNWGSEAKKLVNLYSGLVDKICVE